MDHDQNFKNLILDYPREALSLFAEQEAEAIDASARIIPIREEQLKEKLGDSYRRLDVPLLVEWPDRGGQWLPEPDFIFKFSYAAKGRGLRWTACTDQARISWPES